MMCCDIHPMESSTCRHIVCCTFSDTKNVYFQLLEEIGIATAAQMKSAPRQPQAASQNSVASDELAKRMSALRSQQ